MPYSLVTSAQNPNCHITHRLKAPFWSSDESPSLLKDVGSHQTEL